MRFNTIAVMKHLYFFLLFYAGAFSQEVNIAKDTIEMREVVISEDFSKFKSSKVKIKGNCLYPETMTNVSEVVTLVEKLPMGYLESVTFYFNEMHYNAYKGDSKKFKSTEFEVVLYAVNPDNTVGARIMKDEKYILIMKEHMGATKVHFLEFNIKNQKKLFIGLRRSLPSGEKDFYIDCVCENPKNITLGRSEEKPEWQPRLNCPAMKMEVNVLVSHE